METSVFESDREPENAVAYEDRGAGRALVLLHGHPFDRSMWQPQLEALNADYRVLALDLPGYGASPPRSDPMTMRAFADAVIDVLDTLSIDQAVIVGLSMGGLVAVAERKRAREPAATPS